METRLEIYRDGRLYEYTDGQAVRVISTGGQVNVILEALQFSIAELLVIAPDKTPPDIAEPRGIRHRINEEGFKLLTVFEGCELTAYDDGRGVWTIGYGHTKGVRPGMTISQAQADQFLKEDLEKFESHVNDLVSVSLTEDQFSALVCLCFNIGPGSKGFGGSTLLRLLNRGDYEGATEQFPRWNKVNRKPWLGLTRRRLAEQALFDSKPWEPFRNYNGPMEVFGVAENRVLKLIDPMMRGEDVRRLQNALIEAGFDLGSGGADGVFGKATDKAVRELQAQKNLIVDGIFGDGTRSALEA